MSIFILLQKKFHGKDSLFLYFPALRKRIFFNILSFSLYVVIFLPRCNEIASVTLLNALSIFVKQTEYRREMIET